MTQQEMQRLQLAWDRAIEAGLMEDGTDVNYRVIPDGSVLSDAIGADGQLLVDGRELTGQWAAELRRTKPAFAGLVDNFEQISSRWTKLSAMGACGHSPARPAVRPGAAFGL